MTESIFTKIIKREAPAEIIWENENFIIFMDAFPQVDGQVLVVPKKQVDHFFDLDDETYSELFRTVKWFAPILKKAFKTSRVILIIEGFEVPHVHVKLYPSNVGNHQFPMHNDSLKSRIPENANIIRKTMKEYVK